MYCFKKITESLLYKKVLQGKFSNQDSKQREFVCINDSSIHLYSVENNQIELKSKYDVSCTIQCAEIYSNSNGEDYLLLSTIADSLIMLTFNKISQTFQILAHFCYSYINDKQPQIHQIGRHICVLGTKQKLVVLGAYMKNILTLEYSSGTFIQRSIIKLPNDNFHKIFPSDEKNSSIDNFNILSSELENKESLKTRVLNIKMKTGDMSLQEKRDIIHVISQKNEERQIEVPIDCSIYTDNQGYSNYLILTSLQIVNIKLNKDGNRNKEESTLLKSLYQKDRRQIQPLSIKTFKQFQCILFNDGKCLYFDGFQDNLQQIKKLGLNTLCYGDPNQFEFIDGITPDDDNKEWISISDKSISIAEGGQNNCTVICTIPLFSSIINTAVDQRNGNLFSIINGPTNYLRKVVKGIEARDLQLLQSNLPSCITNSFVNQKDIDQNKQEYKIYLTSAQKSYALIVKQENGQQQFHLSLLNSLFKDIKENEIIKEVSFQENGRVLMVLNQRIVIIDTQSSNIISEQLILNSQKQIDTVVKCTILDNEWIFILTQSNQVLAFQQDFITLKQFPVPEIVYDNLIQNPLANSNAQNSYNSMMNSHTQQLPQHNSLQAPQNSNIKQMQSTDEQENKQNQIISRALNHQISCFHIYKQTIQNNQIFLVIGYYNSTMKILKLNVDNSQLNFQSIRHQHTTSVLHDIQFYNNSETQGLLLTLRNGTIQDMIQIDYSRNIKEQEESLLTFHLEENDISRIFKWNNTLYLQSPHAIYLYKQNGVERDVLQLICQNNKYFQSSPNINLICPLTKDKSIIFSSLNCFTLQSINIQSVRIEYKQIIVPLRTNDIPLQQKLQINNQSGVKRQNMNCFLFKRIIFNRELDAFLIIDQMGCIYVVNRNGYIIQTLEDLPSLYPMMKVVNMKKVTLSERDLYFFITTEKHGGLLVQLQLSANKIQQTSLNIGNVNHKLVTKLIVINQFILQNQQQQDIYFVSDVTVMGLLNFLFICGQNIIFCYEIQKDVESHQEDEKFKFNKISQLILPPQKQIICLDSINNLILIGDLKDSVLVYNIQHKYEGGKHFFSWNLEKTEFNQRALKDSMFVDKSNFLGLDKYGELFGSVTDQKVYHDANFNLHNFSLMNIRETGQIVKFNHYRNKPIQQNNKIDPNRRNDQYSFHNAQYFHKIHNLTRQPIYYVCGIGGSIYQIVYCDLLFNFEVEKYNFYILMVERILRQLKSNNTSQKKNSIDFMRKTRKFGDSQRFVDISLFENLNKQEFCQVFQDLQNQLNKEEAKMLNFEEMKQVFHYMISLFSN